MAKIQRYDGNLQAFASAATGQERVVFGDNSTSPLQSDDLTANIDGNFVRGWGVLPLGSKPPKEWFNSIAFTISQLSAYVHQMGVPEWHAEQEYHEGSRAIAGGRLWELRDNQGVSVGDNPLTSDNWVDPLGAFVGKFEGNVGGAGQLDRALTYADDNDLNSVYTHEPLLDLGTDVDFKNKTLLGAGTELKPNGHVMKDLGATLGVYQDDGGGLVDLNKSMLPAGSAISAGLQKIVYEDGGDVYVITQGGAASSGLLTKILTGNVASPSLPSDSLNANWESWRVASTLPVVAAYLYKKADSETGSWSDFDPTLGALGLPPSVNNLKPVIGRRSRTPGNTITYNATSSRYGKVAVAFQTTSTSDSACEVRIDGSLVDTLDLNTASPGFIIKEYDAKPGQRTVELTHGNGGNLYSLGVNFTPMNRLEGELDVDGVAVYTESPIYIVNENAQDYAFRDTIDDLWGGSYHGGETAIIPVEWTLDGTPIDPTVAGSIFTGKAFSMFQRTQVTWSTQSLTLNNSMRFGDSQFQQAIAASGEVQALTFHPGMSGTSDSFETLLSNRYIDDVTTVETTQQAGNSLRIEQIQRASGRRVISEFTSLGLFNSPDYGGATVNYAPGLYNKLYLSPVRNTNQKIINPAWVFTRTFA